ncbi:SDR family NAD(P)-dependent oxidoreductase [Brevibacillus laterosporus]|uniref:SDR family NAD(P)-dependent oxidoreductase n=1 Tax=Brevibacillus laterosporus TaxID=1465 RepID=A0AAP3DDD1_BRELA|nr:SDR family NAD(P)-dependent oxidoreductase [Brevibacillus laterosporus]MCR8978417.1 SDR family NAD(P)-dependent oxidoreductase [Brevibacillus laterosporus]MCZ0805572.1 SDR family NAD(P)-dependent oxidoreductase [Brevibacillus laterosporus]MCZ0825294.1 SDR family NAD(P)-dependent oxidoreductase [Brevibacillus laterosporus]MCZ0849070.1 SDR family NAD(P)-dependent oxidoreductase [Brevibacillus laterosporus]
MNKMDELLCRLLWGQLQSVGLFTKKIMKISELKTLLDPQYSSWFEETLNKLADNHYLRREEDLCHVMDTTSIDVNAVWKQWDIEKVEWLLDPNRKAQVTLLEAAMRALPKIVTGGVLATDILFPNSTMKLVEGIYKHNPVSDYFNEVLSNTVVAYIQNRIEQKNPERIRILEIGAGTGGTSAMVFEKIKHYQEFVEEYRYTDISKAFLIHAENEYGPSIPYLNYQTLNVEEPITNQNIHTGAFDIVIAANVLHATKNICQTLRNAKSALKKHGLILLNEMSENTLFTHLTFGLLAGWWLYEDPWLRIPGCPGLYPHQWQDALEREGFHSIFFPALQAHELGQQIIVAESDGIVRLQESLPANTGVLKRAHGKDSTSSFTSSRIAQDSEIRSFSQAENKTKTPGNLVAVDDYILEDYVRDRVKVNLSDSIRIDLTKIIDDESFADYGLDSITGVHFVQSINDAFNLTLRTTVPFNYSSVNKLTAYLLEEYRDVILGAFLQNKNPIQVHGKEIEVEENLTRPAYEVNAREAEDFLEKEPIAIIGMSGRFAKSNSVDELWEHLSNGTDLVEEITRWDTPSYYGSFIEDYDQFDPVFFNISGVEATYMDPQQRLFLEESWKTLEDAGYAGGVLDGKLCGVYVGYNIGDYMQLIGDNPPAQAMWGNAGSIIPARIAYYLNLKGPAIAIDTACSSSLVAIHLACQSLWAKEIDMALAGGVFVQSTPRFVASANRAGMLSPGGRCFTFDDRADGFVTGEGVGAVMLKRLKDAVRDGDHIYGVISGSGMNQDGTTNGITAPSGNSQEQLERHVYDTFQIDPEKIQMVEAHGTGTKLGDPIEFEALTNAFRYYTDKKEYCAIGSIKTNIGHTIAAAGVAGFIKILLSLKYKKIPPSLHFQSGNPNIQFTNSPFYVNTHLKEWDIEQGSKRCAVISSFGFSGTNAHMVIEEAPSLVRLHTDKPGYLLVLSAQSYEQLRLQARQLIEYYENNPRVDYGNLSFTLLMGRKHFNHRLACVVKDGEHLGALLNNWLQNDNEADVYVSEIREGGFREHQSMKRHGNQCILTSQNANSLKYVELLTEIAQLFTQGYTLDFEHLFSGEQYTRVPLPTYPFAKERYWVPEKQNATGESVAAKQESIIHPLVHKNTSDLLEQRFSTTFTGEEFFLTDHVLNKQQILPGAAYLEMARLAVELGGGPVLDGKKEVQLKHVVWARPIVVGDQSADVHIGLFPQVNGDIAFEVYSLSQNADDADKIIHCQGQAARKSKNKAYNVDLEALQARCNKSTFSSTQCYEAFREIGFDYGPNHRGVEQLSIGSNEALAKLSLPISLFDTKEPYYLHPGMLDSSLQAMAGVLAAEGDFEPFGSNTRLKPHLPFAIQEIDIMSPCTASMWAYIRNSEGSESNEGIRKMDIDLCDDHGAVCVRIKGFASRILEGAEDRINSGSDTGLLLFEPSWKHEAVNYKAKAPDYAQHLVILCESCEAFRASIENQMDHVRCISLQSTETALDKRYTAYVEQLFETLHSMLTNQLQGQILIQLIVSRQEDQHLFSGLSGMLKTARMENPKLHGQLIEIENAEFSQDIIQILEENKKTPHIQHVRYENGERFYANWSEVERQATESIEVPWKDRGIYLITGGAGGLGLIFAGEIAKCTKNATVVLTGRSPLDASKQEKIKLLQTKGLQVEYRQVDVSKFSAVKELIQRICTEFGSLNGIIHSAGLIRDNYIINKNKEELREVLSPKVSGLVNLDVSTQQLPLDFFILFSAVAGALGNPGQADYAAANAFLDVYATYRNSLVDSQLRHGQTFSICWPLWKAGGMHIDEEIAKLVKQRTGMTALESEKGINALYQCMALRKDQMIVIEGNLKQLRDTFLTALEFEDATNPAADVNNNVAPSATEELLREKATVYFKKILSSVIGLPSQRIDENAPMEKYGIDSLMVMQLTNQLEKSFGSLSKTLFFEFPNIRKLSTYFLENYRDRMMTLIGLEEPIVEKEKRFVTPIKTTELSKQNNGNNSRKRFYEQGSEMENEGEVRNQDIAIIGLSGRYPDARNLEEFWENLKVGKDCIIEIPKERWDHSLFYDEDKSKLGKTYSKWGGFIDGVDQFDPLFFNISPREAEVMDPQERLFLQCVYEALEDSGYTREALGMNRESGLAGNVGVYVGVMYEEYQLYGVQETAWGRPIALSGIPSSIANRVSYFCNFTGPSMAMDTMCSSSITAIHLACHSLQRGECEVAVAGGVNVSIHPNKYLFLSQGKFASSNGRCESFGQGGDGYVPGEGVGAVLLKPLSKAIEDKDNIYGVIKATSINHGGKTNGYSVPNPNAQANVIRRAYKEAGIDPRTISYIEAHGTGTSLGDPIEIAGLTKVFEEYSNDKQFCSIGSAKSNIGHCESAAGIAGLTKVLLQLKHCQLAPSLHAKELNPNIDFINTPFIVQQDLAEWKRPIFNNKEYPRIAGISSFGAGGSNAHMVIEEYIPVEETTASQPVNRQNPVIILLSAKDEERLREHTEQLLEFIERQSLTGSLLADLSYTLQVGREAMEERLAMTVGSIEELKEKLRGFIEEPTRMEDCFWGRVHSNNEMLHILTQDEDLAQAFDVWLEKGKYEKILGLWVKGVNVDWSKLYGELKPRRISLPTYPFAKERYWVPVSDVKPESLNNHALQAAQIHPLLHQNTSDLLQQRFSSTFTGREYFFTDHLVQGKKVLPGAAYMEMARAAVDLAAGALKGAGNGIIFKNMTWLRPLEAFGETIDVHIRLYAEEHGDIAYEVYSENQEKTQEMTIHSKGTALFTSRDDSHVLSLQTLFSECNQRVIHANECYEVFNAMGIEYGSGHQGIESIYLGKDQVLAKLSLPAVIRNTKDQYVLHPSIIDSSLQAAIGLFFNDVNPVTNVRGNEVGPFIPFVLEELQVLNDCTTEMWAWIRYSNTSSSDDKVQKLDIDLCDEQGKLCARMKGLTSRALKTKKDYKDAPIAKETLLLKPYWKESTIHPETEAVRYEKRVVILCEQDEKCKEIIEIEIAGSNCLVLRAESEIQSIDQRFQSYAKRIVIELQEILQQHIEGKLLVQIIVPVKGEQQLFAGLAGILKTARLENPNIVGQLIEWDSDISSQALLEILQENSQKSLDSYIQYKANKRYIQGWNEIKVSERAEALPWKDKGIYLITGGTGSLGFIFAREIAERVKDATLILTGRSPLDVSKKAQLIQLRSLGAKVEYRRLNVSDAGAVNELIDSIENVTGPLNGIIHSAGVTKDGFILKKRTEDVEEVLSPKVTGLVNLDQATSDLQLDFFILFSSLAGCLGNYGQADYAAANAFMDAYARYRNELVTSGQRQGLTLSINWPLWEEGGMHVSEDTMELFMQHTGMTTMGTKNGIKAMYDGFTAGVDQVLVMEGDSFRIRAALLENVTRTQQREALATPIEINQAITATDREALKEKTVDYFKELLSSVIKLPVHRIDTTAPFEKYGIDSITIMHVTSELEKEFGPLSKTLFFEYQNLQELTSYFLGAHHERLLELVGLNEQPDEAVNVVPTLHESVDETVKQSAVLPRVNRFANGQTGPLKTLDQKKEEVGCEDIAIVGVAGRYPGARNIEEFWNNVRDGVDSITEIPKDRWDHSLYFDKEQGKLGKTYSKWGGFLEGIDQFDPLFFNISRREAAFMDPQERLFLQCVYEVMEDAGYTRDALNKQENGLSNHVGVYVGVMYQEYQLYGAQETIQGRPMALSGSASSIANRVSYFCNFHGPSVAVDTMCSSSLTAIHFACQSLQNGECDAAIAGGVNLSIHPNKYVALGQGRFASSKGRCESFGEGGDGYVPGEGVGAVLLKPISKAIADQDHIYGIIKASAINHGGKTNGYSVPNPNAQSSVIDRALKRAGINPRTISYIEAHGTGTSLGDPIEIKGLSKTYEAYTQDKQFCSIGSAKSNIGHCESAAGIAGLTKVLMQLKYAQLAPSLHAKTLNPNITFSQTPFEVQQELAQWNRPIIEMDGERKEYPRIAGISSFGAGGSNAHLIIEEYVQEHQTQEQWRVDADNPAIIVLSAKNKDRLKEQAQRLVASIKDLRITDTELANVAYTLQIGREAFEERLALVISSVQELECKLLEYVRGKEVIEGRYSGQTKGNKELTERSVEKLDKKTLERWIAKKDYGMLLENWVNGMQIDWNVFYGNVKPRRISLYTYPFAKERYWIPVTKRECSTEKGMKANTLLEPADIRTGESRIIEATKQQVDIKNPSFQKESKPNSIILPLLTEVKEAIQKPNEQELQIRTLSLINLNNHVSEPNQDSSPTKESLTLAFTQSEANPTRFTYSLETLREELTEGLAEAMFMQPEEVDVDCKFIDIGVDSIIGVEWVKAINKKYKTSITATKVYDYPSIREFAEYLHKELSESRSFETVDISEPESLLPARLEDEQSADVEEVSTSMILATTQTAAGSPISFAEATNPNGASMSLQEELVKSLAEAMFMQPEEIDVDSKFIDIGVDSIIGVEWIKAINKQYGTSMTATKVYDYPNIRELSAFLMSEIDKSVATTGVESNPKLSFETVDDILERVKNGDLDIDDADQYLNQFLSEGEKK